MGLFKTKEEHELDEIIARINMNMSNNYKDAAQEGFKELELAVMAKSTKDKGTGISSWLKTDRDFWVAYSGSVDVGIDMTKVEMTIVGNEITVSLPNPEIMGIVNIESEEEPICQPDHWYTRENVISSDDKSGAIATANSEMTSQISNDASIMMTTRQRAEDLIRNYIEALAQYSNTDYHVTFVDL